MSEEKRKLLHNKIDEAEYDIVCFKERIEELRKEIFKWKNQIREIRRREIEEKTTNEKEMSIL